MIETGNYNLQLDVKPGMNEQEIELIRQDTLNNLNAQIENNEKIIQDSRIPWDSKVFYTHV